MDLPPHYKDSLVTEVGEGTSGGSCAGSSEPHPGSSSTLTSSHMDLPKYQGLGNKVETRTFSGHHCLLLVSLSARDFLNPQVTARIRLPAEDKMTFNGKPQR